MTKRLYLQATAVLLALACYLATAAGASAATIIVGPRIPTSMPSGGGVINCFTPCTFVNTKLAGGPGTLTSPVDGTIVSWRMRGPSPGGGYRLRVLTPEGPQTYTPTATGPTVIGVGGTEYQTSAAHLPILTGQTIGLDVEAGGVSSFTESSVFHDPAAVEGQSDTYSTFGVSGEFNALILPPPTVTAVSPASGPGGATVVIEGSNLDPEYVESVAFGSTPASFVGVTDSQLSVTVPPGSASVPVSVTTQAGKAAAPEEFTYREPPPTPPAPPLTPTTPAQSASSATQSAATPPAGGWFGIKQVQRDPEKGTAGLAVDFTGSGEVSLTGKGVKTASGKVVGGRLALPVVPTGSLRSTLVRTGKVTATVTVTFKTAGNVWTKTKSLAIRLER